MSCNCPVSTCIKVFVSTCDTGIDIKLTSTVAGDYTFILEFNGAVQQFILTLDEDEDIIIPNCVNGNYLHELQIFQPDGTLLGGTCYGLDVTTVVGSGNGLTPAPSSKDYIIITVNENATTLTDTWLTTHTASKIYANAQAYFSPVDFTQTGDTITGINISFYIGQIIRIEA